MIQNENDADINVNGMIIHAHYSNESVREIFLPFLRSMTTLQQRLRRRILIMLAAPPGAGKTTLASFLELLSVRNEGLGRVQAIGIDGFHRTQDDLLANTVIRNGEEISMLKIKGAPVTFDLKKLTYRIQKVASGEICGWPVYDRLLHNPIDNVITVDSDIVLLEGNYLLLDESGWRDLRQYADYTVMIRAEEELLRSRLIGRRMKTGVSREKSAEFVDYSDMANVRLCMEHSLPADLTLHIGKNNDFAVFDEE